MCCKNEHNWEFFINEEVAIHNFVYIESAIQYKEQVIKCINEHKKRFVIQWVPKGK